MTEDINMLGKWVWLTQNLGCRGNQKIYFCGFFQKLHRPVWCTQEIKKVIVTMEQKQWIFHMQLWPVKAGQKGEGRGGYRLQAALSLKHLVLTGSLSSGRLEDLMFCSSDFMKADILLCSFGTQWYFQELMCPPPPPTSTLPTIFLLCST